MEEKKVKEAIEYLSGYIQSNINLMGKIEGIVWIGEEPCKIAIEALEKQLPKEIKAIDPERSEEFGDVEFCCPNCNSHYLCDIADVPNYCSECGVRFDT